MSLPVDLALLDRIEGRSRTGTVSIRDFDQGVVETMGATITNEHYYLQIDGIAYAPGNPGIDVVFAYPEDIMEKYRLPLVVVSRDDIAPATQRWHPGMLQYRTAGNGALPVSVAVSSSTVTGFDRMEELTQAVPYDFSYSINIFTRNRGAATRQDANAIVNHIARIYQPYSVVYVKDSIGDTRSYEAFMDGISMLDDVPEITERVIGFSLVLRVEGELDLNDPKTQRTVTSLSTVREKEL